MASYNSSYTGAAIDRAGLLPAPNSGSVGQFLQKTSSAGAMAWATVEASGCLMFTNKTIATSAWASDNTYTSYPYKANVACTGVTADMFPQVVFDLDDAVSGYFAPVCRSYAGGVSVYASDIPSSTITIPTIVVMKN